MFLGHGVAEQDGAGWEAPVHADGHDDDTPEGEDPVCLVYGHEGEEQGADEEAEHSAQHEIRCLELSR